MARAGPAPASALTCSPLPSHQKSLLLKRIRLRGIENLQPRLQSSPTRSSRAPVVNTAPALVGCENLTLMHLSSYASKAHAPQLCPPHATLLPGLRGLGPRFSLCKTRGWAGSRSEILSLSEPSRHFNIASCTNMRVPGETTRAHGYRERTRAGGWVVRAARSSRHAGSCPRGL